MIQEELLQVYMELLKKRVEDQYRGHGDYEMILDRIDKDIPFYGGDINVQKEDPRTGKIYTVNYKVNVYDDLGNKVTGIDDMGGKCVLGEYAHKDYIYDCLECHQKFCFKHVRFVDKDESKPLCNHGFLGRKGCFYHEEHTYQSKLKPIEEETEEYLALTEREEARAKYEEARKKRKGINQTDHNVPTPTLKERIIPSQKVKIKCPQCNFEPFKGMPARCSQCGETWYTRKGINCPKCGHRISSVNCGECNNEISI